MNEKERELHRIIDVCVECCAMGGSVTREEVLGRSRKENAVMTRCIVVRYLVNAGYSVTTCSEALHRTVAAIRHLMRLDILFGGNSRAYRIACKEVEDKLG